MHESVLALGVVRELEKALRGLPGVGRVKILVGELQRLDQEVFRGYLDEFLREAGLYIEYELVVERAVLRCLSCGNGWTLEDIGLPEDVRELVHFFPEALYAYVSCPSCGSRLLEVSTGRGLRVVVEG